MQQQVSVKWKYATIGVSVVATGLLVGQFMWWNKRAPGVLKPAS